MISLKELSTVPQSFLYKHDNFWKKYDNHSSINSTFERIISSTQSFLYKHDNIWKGYIQYHNHSSINMITFERLISKTTSIPL